MRTVWIVLLVMSLAITGVMVYAVTSLTTTVEIDNTTSKTVVFHLDNIIVNENISLPAGILYYNKNPTTLQYPYNVTLSLSDVVVGGNTTLTPHLYVWSFDGVDDYIFIGDSPSLDSNIVTMVTSFKPLDTNKYVIAKNNYGTPQYAIFYENEKLLMAWNNGTTTDIIFSTTLPLNEKHYIVGIISSTASIYIDNNLVAQKTTTITPSGTYNLVIGSRHPDYPGFYHGTIYYTIIYNRSLNETEINNIYNNIINDSSLALFLDPSFFNGTHYLDLSPYGNDGVPYGGVSRVPAEEKWLWLVTNSTSDNLIHLRFFPANTIIVFTNTDTQEQTLVTINGTTNAAGLVEDHTINIPAGNYTIEYLGGYTVFGESNNYTLYYIPTENKIITAYKNGTIVNETTLNQPLTLSEDTMVYGPITIEYVLDNNNNVLAEAHYGGYNASNIAYAPTDSPEILYHTSSGNGTITITGVRQGTRISIPTLSQYYNATGAPITITGAMTYKILYYYTENKIYIYTSQKPEDIDLVGLIQPENMIEFYKQWWGAWAYIIPYLLPVSIYIARRSVGLFTATTILIGAAQITFMPEGLRGIGAVGIAFGLTILIYTLVRRRE